MKRIIPFRRSIIVAADVTGFGALTSLTKAVKDVPGIGRFKLGFSLGLQNLTIATDIVKNNLGRDFPVIYDHQKGCNDIPDTGLQFSQVVKQSKVDAVILFPFTGPATQEKWTKECFDEGLGVMVGGIMTHPQFLASEGGCIADEAVEQIYRRACRQGVREFVVPGNKVHWVKKICQILVEELGEGNFVLHAPGFITQKGDISECGQAAGDGEWHAIVGSAIYTKVTVEEQRAAAIALTQQIMHLT